MKDNCTMTDEQVREFYSVILKDRCLEDGTGRIVRNPDGTCHVETIVRDYVPRNKRVTRGDVGTLGNAGNRGL